MLHIAVCTGSQQTARQLLESSHKILEDQKIPHIIDTYPTSSELTAIIARNPRRYELLLLEIVGGLDTAMLLRQMNPDLFLVLLSQTTAFALEGYRTGALRYLLTPVTPESLLDVYQTLHAHYLNRHLLVSTAVGEELLEHNSILYLHTVGRATEIVLLERSVLCSHILSELLQRLPPHRFVRTHQSYVANLQNVQAVQKTSVTLINGCEIPVSRRLHADIRGYLKMYGLVLANRSASMPRPEG